MLHDWQSVLENMLIDVAQWHRFDTVREREM